MTTCDGGRPRVMRLVLAVVLALGLSGLAPSGSMHALADAVHVASSAAAEDCCGRAPLATGSACQALCIQAHTGCAIPAGHGATFPVRSMRAVGWRLSSSGAGGIAPEPATPPPRS